MQHFPSTGSMHAQLYGSSVLLGTRVGWILPCCGRTPVLILGFAPCHIFEAAFDRGRSHFVETCHRLMTFRSIISISCISCCGARSQEVVAHATKCLGNAAESDSGSQRTLRLSVLAQRAHSARISSHARSKIWPFGEHPHMDMKSPEDVTRRVPNKE